MPVFPCWWLFARTRSPAGKAKTVKRYIACAAICAVIFQTNPAVNAKICVDAVSFDNIPVTPRTGFRGDFLEGSFVFNGLTAFAFGARFLDLLAVKV